MELNAIGFQRTQNESTPRATPRYGIRESGDTGVPLEVDRTGYVLLYWSA